MSKRIKELIEQCYEKDELLGTYQFNKERFAKLIIQECINEQLALASNYMAVYKEKADRDSRDYDFVNGVTRGLREGADILIQHFEIEK